MLSCILQVRVATPRRRFNMAKYERTDRVSEEVRRCLDQIIREEVRDPRLSGTYSIVRADVTRDLRWCTVYVSVLEQDKRDGVVKALSSAAGFIRRELGRMVKLHYTPELIFKLDTNIEYAAYVNEILKQDERKRGMEEDENA